MRIKRFNSISLHLGVFLLFLWIDFSLRRCIFEKRAKCIRVRSSLGKQRLRSRGKIHSNSGERCEKEGAVACVSSSRGNSAMAQNTIMRKVFSAWPCFEMQSAMTIVAAAVAIVDNVLQYLLAYRSYRNILSAHFIKTIQATKTNRNF